MPNEKSKVGCPLTLTCDETKNLLYIYKEKYKPMGEISARDIWKFTRELEEQGVIEKAPAEDFWSKKKRIGYKARIEYNTVIAPPIIQPEGRSPSVPKPQDLIKRLS